MQRNIPEGADYAILRPVNQVGIRIESPGAMPGDAFTVAVVDCETTGLDIDAEIIELACIIANVAPATGDVHGVPVAHSWLDQPSAPLPAEIVALTGLTDADLEGHSIDWPAFSDMVADADIVIAHNAGFDRPRIERAAREACANLAPLPWFCSQKQIDWKRKHGAPAAAQEALCWLFGFFSLHGHRALNDCTALLCLLQRAEELGGVHARALEPMLQLYARRSAFECKDRLKARGYKWDAPAKCWYREVSPEDSRGETEWLHANCWGRGFSPEMVAIDPVKRWLEG